MDIERAYLYFKMLSQYPKFYGASPSIGRLYPLAVILGFLLENNLGVEFWVGADRLRDYGAKLDYYFVVGWEDGVGEGAEEAGVVVGHYS